MTELEKAINGLECCVLRDPEDKHRCDVCPYNPSKYDEISNSPCVNGLKAQALALLKEKMPRVMTLDEIYDCAEGDCLYCQCKGVFDGNVLYIRSDAGVYVDLRTATHRFACDTSLYGSLWRCWTSRPSPEMMAITSWEGGETNE